MKEGTRPRSPMASVPTSEKAQERSHLGKDGAFQLKRGPFREYQPIDTYWDHKVGKLNLLDGVVFIAIAAGFGLFITRSYFGSLTVALNVQEKGLFDAIESFKAGKFDLNYIPPFGIQLLSLFPLRKDVIRQVMLVFSSLTLSFLYLTLRRVNTSSLFAVGCTAAIGSLPIFQTESVSVALNPIQWFLLSTTLYFWRSTKCSRHFTKKWFTNLILLSITLGLGAATRYLGIFTWLWVCIVSLKEFWNVLGDPRLTSGYLAKYTVFSALVLGIIPFAVFTSSLSLQLLSWTTDSPEFSQYMSPSFKSYLRGPMEQPRYLYYGSVITLRHHESLGGYLNSHNHTYPTGSGEQQVSLTQEEDDINNKWLVEQSRPNTNGYSPPKKVNDFDKVRLRHCATGKLLRASSAKPPISEQEYNSEVSCTGDDEYVGDSDELWTVISIGDPLHSAIKPLKSLIKFLNEGQGCTMLAHDTRLPEWGFNQQEVLCLRSPTESRTLFEVETEQFKVAEGVEYETFTGDEGTVIGFAKLLIELVQRQYRWNYYENKFKLQSDPTAEKWPFQSFEQKYITNVWLSSVFYPLCLVVHQAIQMLPWRRAITKVTTLDTIIHSDFAIECLLGWFLHYRPFCSSPHADQKISSYLSSLLFGQLLVWKAIDSWCKARLLYGFLLCVYIAYVLHS